MTRCESYPPCFGTIYFPTAPLLASKSLVDFGILAGHFRGTLYIDAEKKEDFCKVVLQLESSGLSVGHFGADITDGNFAQMQEQDTRKRYEREYGKDFEITADPNVITIQIPFQEIK